MANLTDDDGNTLVDRAGNPLTDDLPSGGLTFVGITFAGAGTLRGFATTIDTTPLVISAALSLRLRLHI